MKYLELLSDDIVPDPDQARKTFTGIEKLADSIAEHGLLQNIVVRGKSPRIFEIVAGERRWRAVRLLEKDGRRSQTEKIICLVLEGAVADLQFVNLVENSERLEVAPWDIGRRYLELIDAGFTQDEIAARANTSQVKVSQYARIAKFTAPSIIARLARLGPTALTLAELRRISSLVDPLTDEPDEKRQTELFEKFFRPGNTNRRRIRPPGSAAPKKDRVIRCYNSIAHGNLVVPEAARPVVDAIIAYMGGKTRGVVWPEGFE